jgi:hypothetical protein
MQLVMSDAQAHELACRLFELIDGAAFPREVQAASSALAERLNRISA